MKAISSDNVQNVDEIDEVLVSSLHYMIIKVRLNTISKKCTNAYVLISCFVHRMFINAIIIKYSESVHSFHFILNKFVVPRPNVSLQVSLLCAC